MNSGEIVGCDYIEIYYSVAVGGNTMGVFQTPPNARKWAENHPERVRGEFIVLAYLAPKPESYTL